MNIKVIKYKGVVASFCILSFFLYSASLFAYSKSAYSAGIKGGLNISKEPSSGKSFGISPEVALRLEYNYNNFSVFLDPGYLQARFPLANGIIRADYFKNALYFVYKFPFKSFVPYVIGGAYANVNFTGEYEDYGTGIVYEFKDSLNKLNYGVSGGLGLEFHVWRIELFADTVVSKSLNAVYKSVNNSIVTLNAGEDLSIQSYVGVKYAFYKN